MDRVRASDPVQLAETSFPFEDPRLPEMLFRYRARNYPQSLSAQELAQWEEYRLERLTDPEAGAGLCLEAYQASIENALQSGQLDEEQQTLMHQLQEYGDGLLSPEAISG
jgi:exodeoxyribonuclease-1